MRKISRLFVNTLNGDDKYSLLNRGNLTQHIQMYLSQKQKHFSQFLCAFFKSTSNFQHFQKKITLIAYVFPKLRTLKNVLRQLSKKSRLREPLERQHGKRAETLSQYHEQHLYHILRSL